MMQKAILRLQLPRLYVLPFSLLLLGLTHYSYRAKELLVCWLFLCSIFAALGLVLLATTLAWYAGQKLLELSSGAKTLIPKLALWLAQSLERVLSGPRIIASEASQPPAGPSVAAGILDRRACLVVELAPWVEGSVPK